MKAHTAANTGRPSMQPQVHTLTCVFECVADFVGVIVCVAVFVDLQEACRVVKMR